MSSTICLLEKVLLWCNLHMSFYRVCSWLFHLCHSLFTPKLFPFQTGALATHVTVILSHDLISSKDSWKTVVTFILIIDFDVSQCLTYSELLVQAPAAWRMIEIEWCLYGAAWRYVSLLTQSPFQENGHFPRILYRKFLLNLRKFGSFKQTHDRREGPCEWNVC